jgi:tetratricopeptide (TPR) repeat protein
MKGNIKIHSIIAFVTLVFGLTSAARAQQSPGHGIEGNDPTIKASIDGHVVLSSGHPVNNRIRIKLSSIHDAGMELFTDTTGAFQYGDLQPGNYTIEVVDDDTHQGSATEQVTLHNGQRLTMMIYLKKEEERKNDKAGVTNASEGEKPVPPKARQEYDAGASLAAIGELAGAAKHFNSALKIFPDYMDAHNDLGAVYLKLNRIDEAAEQFESAIKLGPKSFSPRLNMGIMLLGKRKYPEAADQLNQCVSIDSSQASGHLYLGVALLGQVDLVAAKRELAAALDIGGAQFSVAHYYMAYVFIKGGNKGDAIHELESFLGTPSDNKSLVDQATALLGQLKH